MGEGVPRAADLEGETRRLAAPFLSGAWALAAEPVCEDDAIFAGEAAALARAWPRRRQEFAAGRRAARRALEGVGRPAVAIPVGARGAPVWPAGVLGSISHNGGVALALVQRLEAGGPAHAIDLVAEPSDPAFAEVAPVMLRAEEMPGDPAALPRLFSAKEAAIKLLSPMLDDHVPFTDLVSRPGLHGYAIRHVPSGRAVGVAILEPLGCVVALATAVFPR